MRDVVRAYIEKYRLLTENRPVLVGVSGGADSIALLTILVELGLFPYCRRIVIFICGEDESRVMNSL